MQSVLRHRLREFARHVYRGREIHAVSEFCCHHAETNRQMRLPDAGRTQEHHAPTFVEKTTRGEFFDEATINTGLRREVELGKMLLIRKARELKVEFDGAAAGVRASRRQADVRESALSFHP